MNHQAVEDAVTRVEAPEDAGEFSLLSFSPVFRNAIRESLRAETAIAIRVEDLRPPAGASAISMVAKLSVSTTGLPQDEQKRTLADNSVPQVAHVAIKFPNRITQTSGVGCQASDLGPLTFVSS